MHSHPCIENSRTDLTNELEFSLVDLGTGKPRPSKNEIHYCAYQHYDLDNVQVNSLSLFDVIATAKMHSQWLAAITKPITQKPAKGVIHE